MLVAGVDDAGRGSVIGPLIIGGVVTGEEDLPKLVRLGVKDSKLLSPHRRETLAIEIKAIATRHCVVRLLPREIDDVVLNGRKLTSLIGLRQRPWLTSLKCLGQT